MTSLCTYQDENKIAINKTKRYVLVNLDKRSSLWLIRRCFIFIRIWFRSVILETWSLVQDANDALSRIKVSGATPAVECKHVKGTTRYPSLVDEYISHSSDAFSVFHLLNFLLSFSLSLSLFLSLFYNASCQYTLFYLLYMHLQIFDIYLFFSIVFYLFFFFLPK